MQEKMLYVFMAGSTGGTSFAQQLQSEGIQLGWDTRLVPFGDDVSAPISVAGLATRPAVAPDGVRHNHNQPIARTQHFSGGQVGVHLHLDFNHGNNAGIRIHQLNALLQQLKDAEQGGRISLMRV